MASRQRTNSIERDAPRRVIVVGGGIAGLATALGLAEAKVPVLLLSKSEPRRAASVLDPDGFNAACARGDTVALHLEDSSKAAEHAAASAPLRAMVQAAPGLLERLRRHGVPFQPEPLQSPGASAARTFYCGSGTGQQVLFALDDALRARGNERVRDRYEAPGTEPLVERFIGWEMLRLVFDDDRRVVGVIARESRSGTLKAFRGEAVCLATGGYAGLYRGSAASPQSTGSAIGRAVRQGAVFANADAVQFRPLCVPGPDKSFGFSEFLRTSGARLWSTSGTASQDREYFVEQKEPTAFRSLAGAALIRLMRSEAATFVDFTHLPEREVALRFGTLVDTLSDLGLGDAFGESLRVAPRADTSLGGLWVDHELNAQGDLSTTSPRNHSTNLAGLYAVGECAHLYEGNGVLAGDAVLGSMFGGQLAASAITNYTGSLARSAWDLPPSLFEKAEAREREAIGKVAVRERTPESNPFALVRELSSLLGGDAGITSKSLAEQSTGLDEVARRCAQASVNDASSHENRSLSLALELDEIALVTQAMTLTAKSRAEASKSGTSSAARPIFVRFDGELELATDFQGRTNEPRGLTQNEQGAKS